MSTPPTQYWQLTVVPPQDAPAAQGLGLRLRMGGVQLPGQLDRRAVVIRDSPTRVNVHQRDDWSGPLAQMMQSVLAQDPASRLPGRMVSPSHPSPPKGTQTMSVTVLQFTGDAQEKVVLRADWTVGPRGPHRESITRQVRSGGTEATVEGISRALGELADRVAASV